MSDHECADGDVDPTVFLPDWDRRDDEEAAVWRIVDLSAIETYEPSRLSTLDWYASVSWGPVNEAFRQLLYGAGGRPEPALVARLDESGVALSALDREGRWSLARESLTLFPNQITRFRRSPTSAQQVVAST